MYVGNGVVWVMQLEATVWGKKEKAKRRRHFFFVPALARHGSSCLWDGGKNLDLRTDMIWKSINIISKTLPRRSIFALWDMKPGLFSLRWEDIMLWEQFGCIPLPQCRLKMKLSFIYYPVWKQKKTKIYVCAPLVTQIWLCTLTQNSCLTCFLSPVNWTVQNVNWKQTLLWKLESDPVWFDSGWKYFLTAIGHKPSGLLFTSNGTTGQTMFFSPSAFSGDQCYYWVGSNDSVGFFPPRNWISTENRQHVRRHCGKVRLQNNNSSSRADRAGGECSTAIKSLSLKRREWEEDGSPLFCSTSDIKLDLWLPNNYCAVCTCVNITRRVLEAGGWRKGKAR